MYIAMLCMWFITMRMVLSVYSLASLIEREREHHNAGYYCPNVLSTCVRSTNYIFLQFPVWIGIFSYFYYAKQKYSPNLNNFYYFKILFIFCFCCYAVLIINSMFILYLTFNTFILVIIIIIRDCRNKESNNYSEIRYCICGN